MPFGYIFPGFGFGGVALFIAPPSFAYRPPIGFVAGAFDFFIGPGFATFPPFGVI